MSATGTIPYMDLATIEQTRDELAAVEEQRDALQARLEEQIADAARNDARIVDVARAAGISRPKVYRVIHRHGIEVDSERGRQLVAGRWQARPKVGTQPDRALGDFLADRERVKAAERGELPDPDLFGVVDDDGAAPEFNIFETVDRIRAQIRAS